MMTPTAWLLLLGFTLVLTAFNAWRWYELRSAPREHASYHMAGRLTAWSVLALCVLLLARLVGPEWRAAGAWLYLVAVAIMWGLTLFDAIALQALPTHTERRAIAMAITVASVVVAAASLPGNVAQVGGFLLQARNDPCVQGLLAEGASQEAAVWRCTVGPWPTVAPPTAPPTALPSAPGR